MTYGKMFASTFTGSMVGAGPTVFALWAYTIANGYGGQVDLHPRVLATVLGTSEQDVHQALAYLCAPDPMSRSEQEDGRRLRHLKGVAYEIVNHAQYAEMRGAEALREYNRVKKRESRSRCVLDPSSDVNDTSKSPLLSSSLISSDLDPEGVQGEPVTHVRLRKGRRAPADLEPTVEQRARCKELRLDADALMRKFKVHEFNRDYDDWELRFSKWIEDQADRRDRGRGWLTAKHRAYALRYALDLEACAAEFEERHQPENRPLKEAREMFGQFLSARARGSGSAAA